jgi:hypothetical protein
VEVDAAIAAASGPHYCPSCGHSWTGQSSQPPVDAAAAGARAAALQSSGRTFAAALVAMVGESTFEIWLSGLQLVDGTRSTVDLTAPAETASWIRDRFGQVLDVAATDLAGGQVRARILTGTIAGVVTLGDLLLQGGAPAARRPADAPTASVITTTDRTY